MQRKSITTNDIITLLESYEQKRGPFRKYLPSFLGEAQSDDISRLLKVVKTFLEPPDAKMQITLDNLKENKFPQKELNDVQLFEIMTILLDNKSKKDSATGAEVLDKLQQLFNSHGMSLSFLREFKKQGMLDKEALYSLYQAKDEKRAERIFELDKQIKRYRPYPIDISPPSEFFTKLMTGSDISEEVKFLIDSKRFNSKNLTLLCEKKDSAKKMITELAKMDKASLKDGLYPKLDAFILAHPEHTDRFIALFESYTKVAKNSFNKDRFLTLYPYDAKPEATFAAFEKMLEDKLLTDGNFYSFSKLIGRDPNFFPAFLALDDFLHYRRLDNFKAELLISSTCDAMCHNDNTIDKVTTVITFLKQIKDEVFDSEVLLLALQKASRLAEFQSFIAACKEHKIDGLKINDPNLWKADTEKLTLLKTMIGFLYEVSQRYPDLNLLSPERIQKLLSYSLQQLRTAHYDIKNIDEYTQTNHDNSRLYWITSTIDNFPAVFANSVYYAAQTTAICHHITPYMYKNPDLFASPVVRDVIYHLVKSNVSEGVAICELIINMPLRMLEKYRARFDLRELLPKHLQSISAVKELFEGFIEEEHKEHSSEIVEKVRVAFENSADTAIHNLLKDEQSGIIFGFLLPSKEKVQIKKEEDDEPAPTDKISLLQKHSLYSPGKKTEKVIDGDSDFRKFFAKSAKDQSLHSAHAMHDAKGETGITSHMTAVCIKEFLESSIENINVFAAAIAPRTGLTPSIHSGFKAGEGWDSTAAIKDLCTSTEFKEADYVCFTLATGGGRHAVAVVIDKRDEKKIETYCVDPIANSQGQQEAIIKIRRAMESIPELSKVNIREPKDVTQQTDDNYCAVYAFLNSIGVVLKKNEMTIELRDAEDKPIFYPITIDKKGNSTGLETRSNQTLDLIAGAMNVLYERVNAKTAAPSSKSGPIPS